MVLFFIALHFLFQNATYCSQQSRMKQKQNSGNFTVFTVQMFNVVWADAVLKLTHWIIGVEPRGYCDIQSFVWSDLVNICVLIEWITPHVGTPLLHRRAPLHSIAVQVSKSVTNLSHLWANGGLLMSMAWAYCIVKGVEYRFFLK